MGDMASQITSLTIVYSTINSGADQRKHQGFVSLAFVTRSFDVFFICAWINGWVNSREAGDLRRYRAHCDVIVMNPSIRATQDGGLSKEVACHER